MKKTFKLKNLALSLAVAGAASVAMVPAASQAGVSANVGVFTDYVFRGALQSTDTGTPTLQGGFDYEHDSGLFAGIWGSTMDSEYEYDLYAGWGGSFEGFDLGAAYTAYYYTDEDAYGEGPAFEEINLSAGYSLVSVGVDVDVDGDNADYIHYSVSLDASPIAEGVSLTYGMFDNKDADNGSYASIGYGTTIDKAVDLTVDFSMADKNASLTGDEESYLVVGLSKSFDLM